MFNTGIINIISSQFFHHTVLISFSWWCNTQRPFSLSTTPCRSLFIVCEPSFLWCLPQPLYPSNTALHFFQQQRRQPRFVRGFWIPVVSQQPHDLFHLTQGAAGQPGTRHIGSAHESVQGRDGPVSHLMELDVVWKEARVENATTTTGQKTGQQKNRSI